MPKRRRYSQEFKQEAVQLANSSDRSINQVARELGINNNMLSRWCRAYSSEGARAFRGQGGGEL